jgi:hypothetical protein
MAKRVALNDVLPENGGKYAILKDVRECNAGDRRAIHGAVDVRSDGMSMIYPGDHDYRKKNALLSRIITEWNLDLPVPTKDPTSLDRMEIDMIDRLYDATDEYVEFLNEKVVNPTKQGSDPT